MADKSFGVKQLNLIGSTGTPTIESPGNLNLNAGVVAISTDATVGGALTVSGTLEPDDIDMKGGSYLTFYKDNSTSFSSHNSEIYGTSYGTTIWREFAAGAGDGIRIGTKTLTIEPQDLASGAIARFTPGESVKLWWAADGTNRQKFETTGVGVSVLYDYNILGHMDVNTIEATGIVTATTFSGSGSSLTSLNATQLTSGTVSGNRGVTAGSNSSSFVEYNGTTRTSGQFYGGTTDPNGTARLNYSGNFHATNFYGDGSNLTNIGGNTYNALYIDDEGDLIHTVVLPSDVGTTEVFDIDVLSEFFTSDAPSISVPSLTGHLLVTL